MAKINTPPSGCPNDGACAAMADETIQSRRQWHLDKSVSVGHIVTTLVAMVGFFAWALRQEARLTTLENHAIALSDADKRMSKEREILRAEIREDLRQINEKLDRFLERRR